MNVRKLNQFLVIVFLLGIFTCTQNKNESVITYAPLSFDLKSIDTTLGDCSISFCHEIDLKYPVFKQNEELDKWVGQLLYSTRFGSFDIDFITSADAEKQIMEHEKIQYEEGLELREDMNMASQSFYSNLEVSVLWDSLRFISLQSKIDTYSGGAHPNSTVLLISISKDDFSNELMLEEVIDSLKYPEFLRQLKSDFFKTRQLDEQIPVNDQGFWFESGDVEPTENFCFTSEGIRFYYNNYEIAPYVLGATDVTLSWNKLKPFLTPEIIRLLFPSN